MDDERFSDEEYAMRILVLKPKFQKAISLLRKEWRIPAEGFRDNPSINVWKEQLTGDDAERLDAEIFVLLRDLGLSERWQQGVGLYLQTNNPMLLRVQLSGDIKLKFDGEPSNKRNVRSVWIRVFADSTEREIRDDFQYAKSLFDTPQKKKQKPKDLSRDIKVLEMHNAGVKNAAITEWLNDHYGSEKQVFNTDSVVKIIDRMKQKLK